MDESHQESLSHAKTFKDEEIINSKFKSKISKISNFKKFINGRISLRKFKQKEIYKS